MTSHFLCQSAPRQHHDDDSEVRWRGLVLLGFCGAGRVLLRLVRLPRGAAALGPLESWAPTGSWQEADRKLTLPVSVEGLRSRSSGPLWAGPGRAGPGSCPVNTGFSVLQPASRRRSHSGSRLACCVGVQLCTLACTLVVHVSMHVSVHAGSARGRCWTSPELQTEGACERSVQHVDLCRAAPSASCFSIEHFLLRQRLLVEQRRLTGAAADGAAGAAACRVEGAPLI